MANSSSDLIVQFLSTNRPATVSTLSKSLNLTKADIRYHLKALQNNGIIFQVQPDSKKSIPGRPAKKFAIHPDAIPNNYAEILKFFLSNNSTQEDLFSLMSEKLLTAMDFSQVSSTITKLNTLVTELNKRHYDARWESRNNGPVILISNCPYRSLINQFPGFCIMDKMLISKSIGKNIEHQHSFIHFMDCSFQLKIYE